MRSSCRFCAAVARWVQIIDSRLFPCPIRIEDQPDGEPGLTYGRSLGDVRWQEVFENSRLQNLLKTTLDRNYDVRIAASRIEQAAANVGIVRSDQSPQGGATPALVARNHAPIGFARTTEFRLPQETLVATYRDAARLSEIRYRDGVTTYLEVLDSERKVYSAELTLARARLNELASVVQLYDVLGSAWQQ